MKNYVFGLIIIAAAFCLSGAFEPKHETELLPVVVGRGSTLWSIAEANIQYTDYRDIREYVYEIRKVNNLGRTGYIYAGQKLLIPVNK